MPLGRPAGDRSSGYVPTRMPERVYTFMAPLSEQVADVMPDVSVKYILDRLLRDKMVPSLATRLPSEKVSVKPVVAKLTLLPSVVSSVRNL